MVSTALSAKTQNYLSELLRRKVISEASLSDQMLINYLSNLIIDEDYMRVKRPEDYKKNQ